MDPQEGSVQGYSPETGLQGRAAWDRSKPSSATQWLHDGMAPKTLQMVTAAMKLKDACSLEGKLDFLLVFSLEENLDSLLKSRDTT